MADDIIQQVVKPAREERTATGVVDGVKVTLSKKSYNPLNAGKGWWVKVTSGTGHRAKKSGMSHEKAHERFEQLAEEYDLDIRE